MTGTVLSVLTGAPGSGKTASLAAIRQRLAGVVVVDMDAFLDAGSALAGADLRYAAGHWPAYTELCRQLVATVLDSGVDCLLLTPLEPHEVPSWPVGEVRWAVLDCPDPVRRRRLARRGLPADEVEHAVADAAVLRRLALPLISSTGTVPNTAERIAAWVGSARD
jgi:AAA domain-containing protein